MDTKLGWVKLQVYPFKFSSNLVTLKNNTIISAPTVTATHEPDGIYSYNAQHDDWDVFIKYPKHLLSSSHSLAYNPNTKELYLLGFQAQLNKFDINNKQYKSGILPQNCDFGSYPCSLFVDNQLHIIGGNNSDSHFIYDEDTNTFERVHQFLEMTEQTVIYSQLRNIIILFATIGNEQTIWIYNTKTKQWNLSPAKLPCNLTEGACTLTNDNRFILIFGGWVDTYHASGKILVMDLDTMKINQSKIMCPMESTFRVACYCDDNKHRYVLLVCGYIRRWNIKTIKQAPTGILKIIATFCTNEYVHLIEKDTGKHWKISIDEILFNMQNASLKK